MGGGGAGVRPPLGLEPRVGPGASASDFWPPPPDPTLPPLKPGLRLRLCPSPSLHHPRGPAPRRPLLLCSLPLTLPVLAPSPPPASSRGPSAFCLPSLSRTPASSLLPVPSCPAVSRPCTALPCCPLRLSLPPARLPSFIPLHPSFIPLHPSFIPLRLFASFFCVFHSFSFPLSSSSLSPSLSHSVSASPFPSLHFSLSALLFLSLCPLPCFSPPPSPVCQFLSAALSVSPSPSRCPSFLSLSFPLPSSLFLSLPHSCQCHFCDLQLVFSLQLHSHKSDHWQVWLLHGQTGHVARGPPRAGSKGYREEAKTVERSVGGSLDSGGLSGAGGD
ncbi:uncharacterized protein LOC130541300 [Pan paniscus]|uniref:uncharacterized protein LOC130541300 n=1 Tax=Pan paniscus TaxID=9597 RepID=UPI00254644F6|nr:uncharacterized protein LOC130541300 [Pan paniscus]